MGAQSELGSPLLTWLRQLPLISQNQEQLFDQAFWDCFRLLLLLSNFVIAVSTRVIVYITLQTLISATHAFQLTPQLSLLDLNQTNLAPKPIFFPLYSAASIGKHFPGFILYPTTLLNSCIIYSKLVFMALSVYNHAVCTNSSFYFFPLFSSCDFR